MTFVRLALVAFLLTAVSAAAQSTLPDDASTESNVYTNFFFRFRLPYSPSWTPRAQLTREEVRLAGAVPLAAPVSGNPEKPFHNLLMLSRIVPGVGPAGRERATILIVAEDISSEDESSNAVLCVDRFAERQKEAGFMAAGQAREVKFGGRDFARRDFKGKSPSGAPLYQAAFFTLSRNYALGFILTAPTETMLSNMVERTGALKFF
jgi:hypothetical protein